jgi:hypothetical protein
MQVDPPKSRRSFKEGESVFREDLSYWIGIPGLAREIETGHDAGVLVQAGAFGKAA